MITMKFVCALSLLCYSLAFVKGSEKERYSIGINEKGTKFNEAVEIAENENTVVYNVPQHNDVLESHFLVDYDKGRTVTRVPKSKECHVRKTDKNEPSLTETRTNIQILKMMAQKNLNVPVKKKTSIMVKLREIQPRELSQKIFKFCRGNLVYLVKDIPLEEILANYAAEEGSRMQKRGTTTTVSAKVGAYMKNSLQDAYTCKRISTYNNLIKKCYQSKGKIRYRCGLRERTCRYLAICDAVPLKRRPGNSGDIVTISCEEDHDFTAEWCCDIICKTASSQPRIGRPGEKGIRGPPGVPGANR